MRRKFNYLDKNASALKILSFLYRGVPVQVRPRAPFTSKNKQKIPLNTRLYKVFPLGSESCFSFKFEKKCLILIVSKWTQRDIQGHWVSTLCQQSLDLRSGVAHV